MGSFPNILFGAYGDEKVTSSAKIGGHYLGQLMILPDGRKYRYAKSGGTALAVGLLLRGGVQSDTAMEQGAAVAVTAAIGAREITITSGGTTVAANFFEDGYLYTTLSAGVGSVYKIGEHVSAGAASSHVIKFAGNDSLTLAVDTGTKIGLQQNEYARLLINPAGTAFKGIIAGIPPVAVSAGYYFWCQRSGPAVALAGGTAMIIGEGVSCGTAGGDIGELTVAATDDQEMNDVIGHSMVVAAAASYAMINLELE